MTVCWSAPAERGSLGLKDVTATSGLDAELTGMMVHAMATGDVNGDGYADIFVGSFADRPASEYSFRGATGAAPDRLLLGSASRFHVDEAFPPIRGRTAGATFADLDDDGDLDLVLSRNPRPKSNAEAPSVVMRNDGGRFTQATVLDTTRGGRSLGVADLDGDGRLDLILSEDKWTGASSVLLHNDGGLRFSDHTVQAGLPRDIYALGVSAVDLTGDGLADLFFSGSNRLFLNDGDGRFTEETAPEFTWPVYGNEDDVAGVAAGDLNNDGRVDLVLGQHYNSTLDDNRRVPVRVYLNEGKSAGRALTFRDVTAEAGSPGLPTKAPHVEIADLDADGRPDIVTSAASAGKPVILMNRTEQEDAPRFRPLEPVQAPGQPTYWVTGATVDTDHDGRLELFLAEWYPERSSRLWEVRGAGGHWVSVASRAGTVVSAYPPGLAGDATSLLGRQEVVAATGFGAGSQQVARFGLGAKAAADITVAAPGRAPVTFSRVNADTFVDPAGRCRN
ncbi:FG-GAP repeat domain-containing protein [Nostocoides australiense]|uniref:FG-GAP repeat domain-containing protein n=1 Tax=Nostocoides australiense TaxID=99480 RepID=UPI00138F0BAE|nr:VCBS repeat-containing protein [Tetrasphaera australiensis]